MPDAQGNSLSDTMLECIEMCSACHKACLETAMHCLQMGGKHAAASHIRLMLDCVDICHTSAAFMMRGSDLHHHTCGACAAVCQKCAEECQKLAGDDARMASCAEVCRRCAGSCRAMSTSH